MTVTSSAGISSIGEIEQIVIPAKAGIQSFQDLLDPGFRRGDNIRAKFKGLSSSLSARKLFG
jgi:hypothetical protein